MVKKQLRSAAIFVLQTLFGLKAQPLENNPPKGTALVVAPHPDDESLGCGALILWLRSLGKRVRIVVVTDGADSTTSAKISPEKFALIRQTEMQKAAALLGVPETDVVFLSYRDGKASESIDAIAKDLHAQIWLCAPDWLLVPYGLDGHADHRAVASALKNLQEAGKIKARVLAYPMWFWPRGAFSHLCGKAPFQNLFKLETWPFLEKKREAIAAHRSQFENITGEEAYRHLQTSFLEQNLRPCELFFDLSLTNKA